MLIGWAFVGCMSTATGARDRFVRHYACPEERVVVRERPDLKWSAVVLSSREPEAPPSHVRADSERLATWTKERDARWEQRARVLDRHDVFQVTGCGHDVLLGCSHPVQRHNGAIVGDIVVCDEAPATVAAPPSDPAPPRNAP